MKNIFRFLLITTLFTFFLQSCRDDNDVSWTTKAPSFKLYDTTLGSNVLYPTMENNPFQLVWDKYGTSNNYTIVYSETSDFAKSITLATTTSNSYNSTIGELNTALLQAGYSPYSAKQVYFRIQTAGSGSDISVSNTISFTVTPYPVTMPVITSPSSGTSFLLDAKNPDELVTKVTWSDYSTYGVDVKYLVEIALSGTENFIASGEVNNIKLLDWTNKSLNDAVLKAGAQANVATDIDVRVTAVTKTVTEIKKVSDVVTIKVTPYVAFKNIFLVGDATAAGWSTDNNNQAVYRDPVNVNKFYFTGKFGTSMFKLIETLGVDTWQPQWGLKSGSVANSDGGEPNPFTISSSGYYSFEIDILAKTYSLTSYADSMTNYSTIGLIGGFNGWGGDLALSQSSFDSHQWSLKGVAFPAGEVKFRAEGSWSVSWGPTAALQSVSTLSGVGVKQDGQNINLEAGTYDVYFNDIDGRYQFIKK